MIGKLNESLKTSGNITEKELNVLLLVRILCKRWMESHNISKIHECFEKSGQDSAGLKSEQIILELLKIISIADTVTENGYIFYIEVIHLLIVLFSGQLHSKETIFIKLALEVEHDFSKRIVARLLSNFLNRQSIPSSLSMLNVYSYFFKSEEESIMSDKSIMLLLLLINQNPREFINNYRQALCSLVDINSDLKEVGLVRISFKALLDTILRHIKKDEITLLLYTLILKNEEFKVFAVQESDYNILIVSILGVVYNSVVDQVNYSQLYILLSLLLVLSQESLFLEKIHEIVRLII